MTDTAGLTRHANAPRRLVFRTTTPDHPDAAPLLADLQREYDARYGEDLGEPASVELARWPAEDFVAPRGAFVLLHEDDRLVAGGAFKPYDDDTVELKRIWTAPEHRGRGLAALVVAELEAEARRRGFRRVYLTTGPRQPEAVRLYRRAGYTPLYDTARPAEEVGIHPFEKLLGPAPGPRCRGSSRRRPRRAAGSRSRSPRPSTSSSRTARTASGSRRTTCRTRPWSTPR
jgi:polar amino acid transport system permease protein